MLGGAWRACIKEMRRVGAARGGVGPKIQRGGDWEKGRPEGDGRGKRRPAADPPPGGGGGGARGRGAATCGGVKGVAEGREILAKLEANDGNGWETGPTLEMPRGNLYKKIGGYGLAGEG